MTTPPGSGDNPPEGWGPYDGPDRGPDGLNEGPDKRATRRDALVTTGGPRLVLGMLLLGLGGMMALFGFAYGPISRGAGPDGSLSIATGDVHIAMVAAAITIGLGLVSAYLMRGFSAMVVLGLLVALVGIYNLAQLIPLM